MVKLKAIDDVDWQLLAPMAKMLAEHDRFTLSLTAEDSI